MFQFHVSAVEITWAPDRLTALIF